MAVELRIISMMLAIAAATITIGKAMIINQIFTVAASCAFRWSSSLVAKFWNSLTALQVAAVVSALILTVGAVIEYWGKLKLLTLIAIKWILRRSTPFERCVFRKAIPHSIGPILVVLGIAGEVVFEGRTFVVEDRQAVEAEHTVASLKAKTSVNELKTAELERDNLELKALIQVRDLSVDQQKAIGDALKRFSGKFVLIRTYSYDQEAMRLAELITAALKFGKVEVQFSPTAFPGLLNLPVGSG